MGENSCKILLKLAYFEVVDLALVFTSYLQIVTKDCLIRISNSKVKVNASKSANFYGILHEFFHGTLSGVLR